MTMERRVFEREFPGGYKVPMEIQDLVKDGILEDTSWHGDDSPSFGTKLADGDLVRIWVEHPNKKRRTGSEFRYSVFLQRDYARPPHETVVETDDLGEALFHLMNVTQKRGGGRHGQKPRFRLLGRHGQDGQA